MIMISNFLFDFINLCAIVGAAVVAKLVSLGISPLTLFILALKVILVAKLIISGILSSIFFILAVIHLF